MLRALPLLVASALLVKGVVQLFSVPNAGYDLRLLWTASQYLLRGVNPFYASVYAHDIARGVTPSEMPTVLADIGWPEMVNYPPTSVLTQLLIFGWPFDVARLLYIVLTVAGVGVIAWWASRVIDAPRDVKLLVAGMALANLGYSQTIINGNYGIIVVAALALAWTVRVEHPVLAGVALGVALVKPTLSVPFVLLYLAERRLMTVATSAVYLTASAALASALSGDSVPTLVAQTFEGAARFAQGGYGIRQALKAEGVGEIPALALNALPFLLPFGFVLWRGYRTRAQCGLPMLALAAVVARLFTYHNSIDNVILSFLIVALASQAWTEQDTTAVVVTAAIALSVLIPFVWTNSVLGHTLLYLTWGSGALYSAWKSRRAASTATDAGLCVA